jgi:hypothetical protein
MKRSILISLSLLLLLGSCVSKKKYMAINASNQTLLNKLTEANR